jgi:hypothetical protein
MIVDVHTHILPAEYLDKLIAWGGRRFEVTTDTTGRTIVKYKGARFLGVTREMSSTVDRLHDMDRMDNRHRPYRPNSPFAPQLPSHDCRRLSYDAVSFHRPALTCAVMSVGPERPMMWSDYPHVIGDLGRAVASIRELDLPEVDRGRILGDTTRQIFPLCGA